MKEGGKADAVFVNLATSLGGLYLRWGKKEGDIKDRERKSWYLLPCLVKNVLFQYFWPLGGNLASISPRNSVLGGPTEFYSANWSISHAVWEISFYFYDVISQTEYIIRLFPVLYRVGPPCTSEILAKCSHFALQRSWGWAAKHLNSMAFPTRTTQGWAVGTFPFPQMAP